MNSNTNFVSSQSIWGDLHKIKTKIGFGLCQPNIGASFWNLKPLDDGIAILHGEEYKMHVFALKLCDFEFGSHEIQKFYIDHTYTNNNVFDVKLKGNAYWIEYEIETMDTISIPGQKPVGPLNNFVPLFSFDAANFVSVENKKGDITGWTLTYTSN